MPRKIFLDTEFVEDGKTIDLISLAMVDEAGKSLYLVSNEFDLAKAQDHHFVSVHVLPQLPDQSTWVSRDTIKYRILEFVGRGRTAEFWAYYGSYDWVALCQLFGTMDDLPTHFPMYVNEFRQLAGYWRRPEVQIYEHDGKKHDALYDALVLKKWYELYTEQHG